MPSLPNTEDSLLVRTDFSDEAAWQRLCQAIERPVEEFQAYVHKVNDPDFAEATLEQLVNAGTESGKAFLLVADRQAIIEPEHAVLAIDLWEDPGRTFRFIPSVAWSVENNLSLANIDFSEFLNATDENGVFRGFE